MAIYCNFHCEFAVDVPISLTSKLHILCPMERLFLLIINRCVVSELFHSTTSVVYFIVYDKVISFKYSYLNNTPPHNVDTL